ncbi:MAG TPA: orotate phosphoribosyltransferase [Promineifilum sp.]|nr:orotate phosphoribosyltransferase [Promineifilum sp.]HRO91685.1 orotate phosphoribosyltransferase [Promineifilum sp.]
MTTMESLALTLHDIGAIQFGRFRLHSGRESRIYIDLRVLVSFPYALRQATAAYRTVLDGLAFDLLVATPLAGLPIGTALCLDTDKPLIYPRKTAKSYGTGKNIEGRYAIGQTAVVVDDLITSGDSILEAIATVKAAGLKVHDAVVLIDREQGGRAMLEEQGYRLHAVVAIRDLLATLHEHGRLSRYQHDEVLASLGL